MATFAVGCGLAAGNIYRALSLTRVIGRESQVGDAQSGAIVTLTQSYGSLIASLVRVFRTQPVLRRHRTDQACMVASVFLTSVKTLLSGPRWHFSQTQVGLFALAGAAGALFIPLAGHRADCGHGRFITCVALVLAIGALGLTLLENWALVCGAILLDRHVYGGAVIRFAAAGVAFPTVVFFYCLPETVSSKSRTARS